MVANTGQPFETTLIPSIQLFWPFFFFSMEDLPPPLLVEILTRLNDSTDLARCRLASKTLNSLSNEVHYVNLLCTFSRYLKSRSPETKAHVTSFKAIFNNLVREARCLNSISIGVDKSLRDIPYDDVDDESDDLYLTDVGFVKEWLPKVCGELRKLSISDFWIQSCWRKSEVLSFISSCCNGLIELELKNAWLSVDGLNPMTMVNKMATVPGQLIWEIVKKNNCFLVKEFGRGNASVQFSKESNNLYNLNSYKHSGLANKKTVTIQSGGKDQSVLLATSKTKKQNKRASLLHKSVMKKEFPRMAKAVVNQVADNYYRPDLKKAALARLSAVHRSLKVAKSGVKKRNRQAVRIGRK
ncbi:F-box/LRR-repeat protein At4g29420-like isoform X2 [Durio zibethinus]|uniref:F-box/LRR-repeat protein At4g29420-like isoform X2 n=2 Tax=Durio zibethinus TaxID=66656 RepID=A0A6P5XP26_DURZI|nr:F-box/LRR-repeat protein At4g29420-like isoform X2 [Durio zibethinus]